MVGTGDDRQTLGRRQRRPQRLPEVRRDDPVVLGNCNENRPTERRQIGRTVIPVSQQCAHRQQWVMMARDVLQLVPGSDQQHTGNGVAAARTGRRGNTGTKRFANDQ